MFKSAFGYNSRRLHQYRARKPSVSGLFCFSDTHKNVLGRCWVFHISLFPSFWGTAGHILGGRLERVGCRPATSLIGVNSLFHPDCVVEIEATVVD